jgi:dCTP diphosphatase
VSEEPVAELQRRLRDFARERDWEQFHTPKNLAMALAGEVGELVEIFQWLTPEEASQVMEGPRADDVEDELADVLIYLLRIADVLGIDLAEATRAKLERNEHRYPAPHVRGRADRAPQP